MSGNSDLSSIPTTLRPLGPPPPKPKPGYHWAAALVGVCLVIGIVMLSVGLYSLPWDPVRAGGWAFALSLMFLVPCAIVVLLLSWALIAVMRRVGARTWPGILQALPAVVLVLGLLVLLASWMFTNPES